MLPYFASITVLNSTITFVPRVLLTHSMPARTISIMRLAGAANFGAHPPPTIYKKLNSNDMIKGTAREFLRNLGISTFRMSRICARGRQSLEQETLARYLNSLAKLRSMRWYFHFSFIRRAIQGARYKFTIRFTTACSKWSVWQVLGTIVVRDIRLFTWEFFTSLTGLKASFGLCRYVSITHLFGFEYKKCGSLVIVL